MATSEVVHKPFHQPSILRTPTSHPLHRIAEGCVSGDGSDRAVSIFKTMVEIAGMRRDTGSNGTQRQPQAGFQASCDISQIICSLNALEFVAYHAISVPEVPKSIAEILPRVSNIEITEITRPFDGRIKTCSDVVSGVAFLHSRKPNTGFIFTESEIGTEIDLKAALGRMAMIPKNNHIATANGISPMHAISSLIRPSLAIPFIDYAMCLGTWGRIAYVDFDKGNGSADLELRTTDAKISLFEVTEKNEPGLWMTDITGKINQEICKSKNSTGYAVVFTPHTTAGIIPAADKPNVIRQIMETLYMIAPRDAEYMHDLTAKDGNGISHVMGSITGPQVMVHFTDRKIDGVIVDGAMRSDYKVIFADTDVLTPRARKVIVATF